MEASVDPQPPGSRLDADHPENGVLIPRRNTRSPGLHYGGARGCRRLLVALLSVRVLLLSAKQLFLAAKQLFLAAKHAGACMSLARGRFQRELSARQPGYTLWTVIQ
jgi:hypothetical protein